MAAPPNMATTEKIRRSERGLLPPARNESAAKPVRVSVKTVVVRSGTARRRTVALRSPSPKRLI